MPPDKIILFDGVCNLCNALVRFIIRHDHSRELMFAPLQSSYGQRFLNEHVTNLDDRNSVIYISGDQYYSRSTAILSILRDMGSGWRLFYGLIIIPRFIRDSVYEIISKYRYRIFGRSENCMVPSPEIKGRFLD